MKHKLIKLIFQILHLVSVFFLCHLLGWQIALTIYALALSLVVLGFVSWIEK